MSVITVHSSANYGSCLQAYATQKTIESLGYECELVDYRRRNTTVEGTVDASFTSGKLSRLGPVWHIRLLKASAGFILKKRAERYSHPFDTFRASELNLTRPYYSEAELEDDTPVGDVYLTGSDQVWNSIWNDGFDEPYYLAYAPEGARRVAWAASIGRERLDDWEIDPMKRALSRYDAISLRESSGVEIVRSLGFSDASLVLDPTLMLTRKDWSKVAQRPDVISTPYILVYQLNPSKEVESYARAAADCYNLPLIKLSTRRLDSIRGAHNLVLPAVKEFVWLFANASYVITDSFHGTAFSLNLGVPFVSVLPPRFSTRLTSILSLAGENNRLLADFRDIGLLGRPVNFGEVSRRLDAARLKSLDFLKEALDG